MKKLTSLALVLALCLSLAVPALAAESPAYQDAGIVAPETITITPETITITNMTAQEAPALAASGWWVKRVNCESGAILSLKESYIKSETQEDIAIQYARIAKVDSIEVMIIDPYLCINIEENEADEGREIKPGDSALSLEDGQWLIEVMWETDPGIYFLAECIYVNVGGSPAPSVHFIDVPADAWYADAVSWAVSKGITTGTTATTFSPMQTCTEAQILTFLWRAKGSPEPKTAPDSTEYYAKAAKWAVEQGIVDEFEAAAPCTRAMTVEFLWKAAGKPKSNAKPAFTDIEGDGELAQAVAWAVEKGVTTGTSETTFTPGQICNRGQIVTFLYRNLK